MKLQLNKKKLKNLSKDAEILPIEATPQVGGGDDENPTLASCPQGTCVGIPGTDPWPDPHTARCHTAGCPSHNGCDTSADRCNNTLACNTGQCY